MHIHKHVVEWQSYDFELNCRPVCAGTPDLVVL
jgi:hypothetical protein